MSYKRNFSNKPFYRFKRKSYTSSCFFENANVSRLTIPILIGSANDGHSLANIALRTKHTKIYVCLQNEKFDVTVITDPANITRHFGRLPNVPNTRMADFIDFKANIGGLENYVSELNINAEQDGNLIYLDGSVESMLTNFVKKRIFELDIYDCQKSKWKSFFINTELIDFEWGDKSVENNIQNIKFTAILKKRC